MSWLDDIYNMGSEAQTQAGNAAAGVASGIDQADVGADRNADGQVLGSGSPDGGGQFSLAGGWSLHMGAGGVWWLSNPSGQPVRNFGTEMTEDQIATFRNMSAGDISQARVGQNGDVLVRGQPVPPPSANNRGSPGGTGPGTGGATQIPGGGGGGGGGSPGGSWGPPPSGNTGTTPPIGGAPGSGQTNPALDWNTPIGSIQNPGGGSIGSLPGLNPSGGIAVPSIWDVVGNNPTLGQVAGGVDEINRRLLQGQLDISAGMFGGYNSDPNVQANRGLVGQLLSNPYSLNDQVVSQMRGQITDRANQQGNNLADYARQRAASMGTGRDEGERQAMSAYRSAANQAAEGSRQLDVQRAVQNGQDIRSAIQSGGQQTSTDWQHQQAIAGGALQSLGNAQFSGDAFLQSALAAAGAQSAQNGNRGPEIRYDYTPPSFLGGFAS